MHIRKCSSFSHVTDVTATCSFVRGLSLSVCITLCTDIVLELLIYMYRLSHYATILIVGECILLLYVINNIQ
jgi:hypothetical protein